MRMQTFPHLAFLARGLLFAMWFVPCTQGSLLWRMWQQEKRDCTLIIAIRENNPDVVAASLKAGANANASDCDTPPTSFWKFCQAHAFGASPTRKGIKFPPALLVEPYPIDCGDAHHHIRFPGKKIVIVQMLLDYGADINAQDAQGCTELIHAVEHDQEDVLRLLLQRKARLDIKDKQGDTAFVHACMNSQPRFVHLLQ